MPAHTEFRPHFSEDEYRHFLQIFWQKNTIVAGLHRLKDSYVQEELGQEADFWSELLAESREDAFIDKIVPRWGARKELRKGQIIQEIGVRQLEKLQSGAPLAHVVAISVIEAARNIAREHSLVHDLHLTGVCWEFQDWNEPKAYFAKGIMLNDKVSARVDLIDKLIPDLLPHGCDGDALTTLASDCLKDIALGCAATRQVLEAIKQPLEDHAKTTFQIVLRPYKSNGTGTGEPARGLRTLEGIDRRYGD